MAATPHLALMFSLLWTATSVQAFQEERPADVPPPASAPSAGLNDPAAAPGPGGKRAPEGTEITVPGIGKLGTLPKMDFGLELLYGGNQQRPTENTDPNNPALTPEDDDLRIRGTMKHTF